MKCTDHKSNMWAGVAGGGVIYCSRSPNQEPYTLGSHRMDDCMETHTQALATTLEQELSYLAVWVLLGGVVFVTEQLFTGRAATGSLVGCLVFFCSLHS